jgi:uncharacterized membrane protein
MFRLKKLVIVLEKHPAYVFLGLALIFGFIFIFTLAPLSGTDEVTHFPRVYQITDGTLWERKLPNDQYGGYLPSNINRMINDYRNLSREPTSGQFLANTQKLNKEYGSIHNVGKQKAPAIFTSTVFYPPWAYIPSVIGVLIAKLSHLPLIWYVYLGRICSLLAWIAITAIAIRLMPSGKWLLVTIALLPTSLTQAATISADGLVNGLSWLIIALTLAIIAKQVRLRWSILGVLTFLMVYLSIIKESYWLIALFPFVVPISLFKTRLQGIVWRSVSAIGLAIALVWFTINSTKKVSNVVLTPTIGVNVNTKAQMHYLGHHLMAFTIRALWQPFTKSFDTIYLGIVGIYTNRLIYLSILIIGLLFFALYWGTRNTEWVPAFSRYRRRLALVAALIIVGTYLLIATSFYLTETSVGAAAINSIYGRYFLPLLPLLAVFPMAFRQKHYAATALTVYVPVIISIIALASTIMSIQ